MRVIPDQNYDLNWVTEIPRNVPRAWDFEPTEYAVRLPIEGDQEFRNSEELDPWCKSQLLRHSEIINEQDFIKKLKILEKWGGYLNIHKMAIIVIRDQTLALTKTMEIMGPRISILCIKEYCATVCKLWPNKIQRDQTGNKIVPTGRGATKIIKIYGRIIEKDLVAAKSMTGWLKWANRRIKFKSLSKFAAIINELAEELGPISFGWFKKLQFQLDVILTMRLYTLENHVVINEYISSFETWAKEMNTIEAVHKKVGGQIIKISAQNVQLNDTLFEQLLSLRQAGQARQVPAPQDMSYHEESSGYISFA